MTDINSEEIVLHRREFVIEINTRQAAKELIDGPAETQAAFFLDMVNAIEDWPHRIRSAIPSWPMQCRYICDLMDAGQRQVVVIMLDTLVEHLKEPIE